MIKNKMKEYSIKLKHNELKLIIDLLELSIKDKIKHSLFYWLHSKLNKIYLDKK